MAAEELLVRARLRDELSRPLARIRREMESVGRTASTRMGRGLQFGTNALRTMGPTAARTGALLGGALVSGAAAAGVAIGLLGMQAVKAASSLGEEQNKASVLFGASAQSIIEWSKTAADAIGLPAAEALRGAGNIGAMLQTAGVATDASADMSKQMVQLAADMASFNNEDPSEMLDRLRAGLSGEAEPLRRFGVLLSESRVKQKALEMGIASGSGALTDQQKVLARHALILEDTAKQQGDFARTADSLPNLMRRIKGVTTDALAGVGQAILPALIEVAKVIKDTIGPALQSLTPVLTMVVQAIGTLLQPLINAALPILQQLGELFAQLVPVVMPLIPVLARLAMTLLNALMPIVIPFAEMLVEVAIIVAETLIPVIDQLAPVILEVFNAIRPLIPLGYRLLSLFVQIALPVLMPLLQLFANLVELLAGPVAGAMKLIANVVLETLNLIAQGTARLFGWLPFVGEGIRNAADEFKTLKSEALGSFNAIGNTKVGAPTFSAPTLTAPSIVSPSGLGPATVGSDGVAAPTFAGAPDAGTTVSGPLIGTVQVATPDDVEVVVRKVMRAVKREEQERARSGGL